MVFNGAAQCGAAVGELDLDSAGDRHLVERQDVGGLRVCGVGDGLQHGGRGGADRGVKADSLVDLGVLVYEALQIPAGRPVG